VKYLSMIEIIGDFLNKYPLSDESKKQLKRVSKLDLPVQTACVYREAIRSSCADLF
jgi:hypothetical protein